MTIGEARLEQVGSGQAPTTPGWFVVNVADAAWVRNDAFGNRCAFEASPRVLQQRPDVEPQTFDAIGYTLAVLEPGKPSGMYHAETDQEDFLVLQGSCALIVEDQERELQAWDFAHCPPGTAHVFVGTGQTPCVILMIGSRGGGHAIEYPASEVAQARGAGVQQAVDSPREAYAPFPAWTLGRPPRWTELPWGS